LFWVAGLARFSIVGLFQILVAGGYDPDVNIHFLIGS
jgi:hypothetical protein